MHQAFMRPGVRRQCAPGVMATASRALQHRVGARGRRAGRAPRARTRIARARAAEMLGEMLTKDDLLLRCAPWGNVCVVYGTHYVPIALPSIVGSLVLFAPLAWAVKEVRARDVEIFKLRERLGETDDET
jgi:hypothetical protein